jgi:hypothetical protein
MANYKVKFTKQHWMFPNYKVGDIAVLEEEDALMLSKDGCADLLDQVPLSPSPRSDVTSDKLEESTPEDPDTKGLPMTEKGKNKVVDSLIRFRAWLSKKIVSWLGKYAA